MEKGRKEIFKSNVYMERPYLPDISRFDIRVARIEHIIEHPGEEETGGLYLQNIIYYDKYQFAGEMEFKLAINRVPHYYTEEALYNMLVVVLCNPRPEVKYDMISRAKMLCAAANDRLELLIPPEGSEAGDIVSIAGYPPNPEVPFLMPMDNVLGVVSAEVRVNSNKQAVYKGIPLIVEGKGFVTTAMLSDCPVTFE